VTEKAREKGISVSVITIKGTACLLPVIGQMADGTGGNVTIVDLLNILSHQLIELGHLNDLRPPVSSLPDTSMFTSYVPS